MGRSERRGSAGTRDSPMDRVSTGVPSVARTSVTLAVGGPDPGTAAAEDGDSGGGLATGVESPEVVAVFRTNRRAAAARKREGREGVPSTPLASDMILLLIQVGIPKDLSYRDR